MAGLLHSKKCATESMEAMLCSYISSRFRTHPLVQAAVFENVLIDDFVNTQDILHFVDHSFQGPCKQRSFSG